MERAEEGGTWKNVWGWDGKSARWPHSGVGGNEERGRVIPGFGFRGSLRGQTTKAETREGADLAAPSSCNHSYNVPNNGRVVPLPPPPRVCYYFGLSSRSIITVLGTVEIPVRTRRVIIYSPHETK